MTDLLGPASAANATTSRPTDARVFGGSDTFFKDCTSPAANDGTVVEQAYLNGMLQQIRRAIRGMSVIENNADDDMLLKAIQANAAASAKLSDVVTYNAIYPYNGMSGGYATPTGSIVLNASGNNYCIFRGVQGFSTAAMTLAQRTFTTTANNTYHLRWLRVGGLVLRWLGDAGYNPGAQAETISGFDSNYDDCLVARIVTNSSNVLTVTVLTNLPSMNVVGNTYLTVVTPNTNTTFGTATVTLNWARTPQIMLAQFQGNANDTTPHDQDFQMQLTALNRYNFTIRIDDDWTINIGAMWHAICVA